MTVDLLLLVIDHLSLDNNILPTVIDFLSVVIDLL